MKRLPLLLAVLLLLHLPACGVHLEGGGKADERMEQIVSAIEDKDSETLKSFFSQVALAGAEDLDASIESLFAFVQGDIESWEYWTRTYRKKADYGKKSLKVRAEYTVKTDAEEYMFHFIDYIYDTYDPNNEGLYMLEIYKTSYDGNHVERSGVVITE